MTTTVATETQLSDLVLWQLSGKDRGVNLTFIHGAIICQTSTLMQLITTPPRQGIITADGHQLLASSFESDKAAVLLLQKVLGMVGSCGVALTLSQWSLSYYQGCMSRLQVANSVPAVVPEHLPLWALCRRFFRRTKHTIQSDVLARLLGHPMHKILRQAATGGHLYTALLVKPTSTSTLAFPPYTDTSRVGQLSNAQT